MDGLGLGLLDCYLVLELNNRFGGVWYCLYEIPFPPMRLAAIVMVTACGVVLTHTGQVGHKTAQTSKENG